MSDNITMFNQLKHDPGYPPHPLKLIVGVDNEGIVNEVIFLHKVETTYSF